MQGGREGGIARERERKRERERERQREREKRERERKKERKRERRKERERERSCGSVFFHPCLYCTVGPKSIQATLEISSFTNIFCRKYL